MSNVIRLWDTLLSDPKRFNFLNFVSVATVLTKRDICLEGDFAECMETLQRATESITDVRTLLNSAKTLMLQYDKARQSEESWVDLKGATIV